jgi:hypothetical protein
MVYTIYKICCDDVPDAYVGSTKNYYLRTHKHKHDCKKSNTKLYQTIRENGGWQNWKFEILEEHEDISITELRLKEEEYRKQFGTLNTNKCYLTDAQYKEYYKEYGRKYRNKHPEYFREYGKKYRQENPEYFRNYYHVRKLIDA